MRWLLCGTLLFLAACVPTQPTIPEILELKVGDGLAWPSGPRTSNSCGTRTIEEIRGNLVRFSERDDWSNLGHWGHIRVCSRGGE